MPSLQLNTTARAPARAEPQRAKAENVRTRASASPEPGATAPAGADFVYKASSAQASPGCAGLQSGPQSSGSDAWPSTRSAIGAFGDSAPRVIACLDRLDVGACYPYG